MYQNGIGLLAIIKTLTYTFEERRKHADALSEIKEMFNTFKQGKFTASFLLEKWKYLTKW